MPKFRIPKSGTNSPVPEDFFIVPTKNVSDGKVRRGSLASASTQPSFNGSLPGSDYGQSQPSVMAIKNQKKPGGGNPMSKAYRGVWATNNNLSDEIGKFFKGDPFFDDGSIFTADTYEERLMDAPLDPLFDVTGQAASSSTEFLIDMRLAGRDEGRHINLNHPGRDLEEISEGLSRTLEDLGAHLGANDYSKVEGRHDRVTMPVPRVQSLEIDKRVSRHSDHSSREGTVASTNRTFATNPLFFTRGSDPWKGSFDQSLRN